MALEYNTANVRYPKNRGPQNRRIALPAGGAASRMVRGGEGGIRTHVTITREHAFQSCSFSHSDTSPCQLFQSKPVLQLQTGRSGKFAAPMILGLSGPEPQEKKRHGVILFAPGTEKCQLNTAGL